MSMNENHMDSLWRNVEIVGLIGTAVLFVATVAMMAILVMVGAKPTNEVLLQEIGLAGNLTNIVEPSIAVTDILLYARSLSRLGVDPVKVLREGRATVFHAERADELELEVNRLRASWVRRCQGGEKIENVALGR